MPWPLALCSPRTGLGDSSGEAPSGDECGWGNYQPWGSTSGAVDASAIRCEPDCARAGVVSERSPENVAQATTVGQWC